jgi:hypothetical protein
MPQELFECYSETCEIYPIGDDEVSINSCITPQSCVMKPTWLTANFFDFTRSPKLFGTLILMKVSLKWMDGLDGTCQAMIITTRNNSQKGTPDTTGRKFIHERICFDGYDYNDDHWKADFNKAVSGLHSVVSAQVIRGIREKVEGGKISRMKKFGGTPKQSLMSFWSEGRNTYGCRESLLWLHTLFVSARMRSRELLRIINCVQCNKCRLHGKIAMMGLSTALQIHIGPSGDGVDPNRIHRVELAALISTLYKFSRAVKFCQEMK